MKRDAKSAIVHANLQLCCPRERFSTHVGWLFACMKESLISRYGNVTAQTCRVCDNDSLFLLFAHAHCAEKYGAERNIARLGCSVAFSCYEGRIWQVASTLKQALLQWFSRKV
jgi:hypothetical protein